MLITSRGKQRLVKNYFDRVIPYMIVKRQTLLNFLKVFIENFEGKLYLSNNIALVIAYDKEEIHRNIQ